jgi:hypothetical protein
MVSVLAKVTTYSSATATPTSAVTKIIGDKPPDSSSFFMEDQIPGAAVDKHPFPYLTRRQSSSPHPRQQETVSGSDD